MGIDNGGGKGEEQGIKERRGKSRRLRGRKGMDKGKRMRRERVEEEDGRVKEERRGWKKSGLRLRLRLTVGGRRGRKVTAKNR